MFRISYPAWSGSSGSVTAAMASLEQAAMMTCRWATVRRGGTRITGGFTTATTVTPLQETTATLGCTTRIRTTVGYRRGLATTGVTSFEQVATATFRGATRIDTAITDNHGRAIAGRRLTGSILGHQPTAAKGDHNSKRKCDEVFHRYFSNRFIQRCKLKNGITKGSK